MIQKDNYNFFLNVFFEKVSQFPEKIAIVTESTSITYKDLYEKAMCFSVYLIEKYPNEKIIAVSSNKDVNSIVGILATCIVGKTFIPISQLIPAERINQILEDSSSVFIDCEEINCVIESNNFTNESENLVNSWIHSIQEACKSFYIIYTSGTTGNPKGVLMNYKEVFNTIDVLIDEYDIGHNDCLLNLAPLDFDLSIFDIFATLKCGAKLVLFDDAKNVKKVIYTIQEHDVTIWNSVPTVMELLVLYMSYGLPKNKTFNSLRLVFLSGAPTKIDIAKKILIRFPKAKLVCMGGATECGIWTTSIEYTNQPHLDNYTFVPYGSALSNQKIIVLNDDFQEVDKEEVGELYIGGGSLAEKYFNNDEKTKEAFVTLGERWYKTGDSMKYDDRNELIFCGRIDRQVKINGFRVELDAIEQIIQNVIGVNNIVVERDNKIILIHESGQSGTQIKNLLSKQLPEYMLPNLTIEIGKIPLTKNGKKDYSKAKSLTA
ncbi:amino acid adenylation domain-containing protein [Listeria monocytogenes]|uniref:AMP-binding protein n=1 Tax=Listeria monocytogenes TaxID=1639 RepID=UPI0011EB5280|nr:AMP-binding protein [Listeria monocytogenes]TYV59340.1 amino acid adenylation domain-containing protein [Listeria monocytogenes]